MTSSSLRVEALTAGYSGSSVVNGVSLEVQPGEVVALLGRNGVGKTTAVSAIAGTLPTTSGKVFLGDTDVSGLRASQRFRLGLRTMRQERPVISALTVQENLAIVGANISKAVSYFPFLATKLGQTAGTLSGGEQKMLALARQATNSGRVWILDEPTEGLQPSRVDQCSQMIRDAAAIGCAVLLVEQHLAMALNTADRWYLMEKGVFKWFGDVDASTFDSVAHELAV